MRGLFTVLVVWALKSVTATLPLPAHLTNIPLSHDVPLKLLPIYQKQQVIRLRRTPQLDKALLDEELDVWVVRNDTVDVRIYTPNKLQNLVSLMKNLEPKILVQDIQFMVDREAKEIREKSVLRQRQKLLLQQQTIPSNWHDSYHRLADIEHFFETLAIVYPDLVRVERFGQTYQQRQLLRVSLGLQSRSEEPKRQRIWIQALQHAREWIAGATVQYIADRLTSGYGKDPNITWLLDNAEIVLVPVANPDGYEFSWTRERLWRKNRHQLSRQVFGVDTNRNWPDHWNTGGSSTNPRSEVYMGTGPASELEVQSLMNEFRATPNVVGAIDYHSYSQLFLYPVGYTQKPAQHQKQFVEMGRLFRKAVGNQTNFKVEQSSELYIASGGVDDWWYSDEVAAERGYHVPGLCIELNPDEDSLTGFIIPASNIRPIGEEQTRGLVALALHFISNPLL